MTTLSFFTPQQYYCLRYSLNFHKVLLTTAYHVKQDDHARVIAIEVLLYY